jgi:hypothetical protein
MPFTAVETINYLDLLTNYASSELLEESRGIKNHTLP